MLRAPPTYRQVDDRNIQCPEDSEYGGESAHAQVMPHVAAEHQVGNEEKPENQRIAAQILSGFLGHTCQVRCVYEPDNDHLVKAALRNTEIGAQVINTEET